jgi:hypothetical protein
MTITKTEIFQYVTQLTEHLELICVKIHRNFQSCGLPCTSLQLQKQTYSTSGSNKIQTAGMRVLYRAKACTILHVSH